MSVLEGKYQGRTLLSAGVGGALGALALFATTVPVPFLDSAVGGAVAGAFAGQMHWTTRESGVRVGVLAGLVAFVGSWLLVGLLVYVAAAAVSVSVDTFVGLLVQEYDHGQVADIAVLEAIHFVILVAAAAGGGYLGGRRAEKERDVTATRS